MTRNCAPADHLHGVAIAGEGTPALQGRATQRGSQATRNLYFDERDKELEAFEEGVSPARDGITDRAALLARRSLPHPPAVIAAPLLFQDTGCHFAGPSLPV